MKFGNVTKRPGGDPRSKEANTNGDADKLRAQDTQPLTDDQLDGVAGGGDMLNEVIAGKAGAAGKAGKISHNWVI